TQSHALAKRVAPKLSALALLRREVSIALGSGGYFELIKFFCNDLKWEVPKTTIFKFAWCNAQRSLVTNIRVVHDHIFLPGVHRGAHFLDSYRTSISDWVGRCNNLTFIQDFFAGKLG